MPVNIQPNAYVWLVPATVPAHSLEESELISTEPVLGPEDRREDSSLLVNLLPGHKPLLGRIQLSVTRTLLYNLGKFFQEKSYTIINIKLGTKVNISLEREIITIAYFLKS